MSGKLEFYYFGDDEAYFRALQGEFRKHARVPIEFKRFFETSEVRIQSLFLKIFNDRPACVFVDFSKSTQDYLHLARLISRTPFEHQFLMVGLVDYLSPPEVLKESIATGAHLNFIKSAETFDVAFGVTKLVSPQSIGEHGFANASLKEEWETGVLCKIGYVQEDGIHIESDYPLSKGDRVVLNHHWLEKRVVPSRHCFVKNVSASNMFYQFKLNADIDFLFVDDFLPPEGMDQEEIKAKNEERDELVRYHKKQLKKWLDDHADSSQEKRAKVLVVDYEFNFYQDQARTDKHPYTIRCIPFFNNISQELDRLNPQVIAVNLDTGDKPKNTLDALRTLVSILHTRVSDVSPYLIVFGSDLSSQDLQDSLQYAQTIAHSENLSPELLIKMADMLQKKMANVQAIPAKQQLKVFIKKNHPASVAEILKPVQVVKLSETDMILQSEFQYPPGTNLHFLKPVEMFVNIQPVAKPSGKLPEYYGLIHSIGESEKKELRRFVNSVFFRDHDAQVNAEADEFKKLNDLKLQEKIKLETKAREILEAKAKAEAQEKAKEEAAQVPEKPKESEVS